MNQKILLFGLAAILVGVTVFHGLLVTGITGSSWNPYQREPETPKEEVSYIACGCGCCPGLDLEPEEQCIYHANGDDLQNIIDLDRVAAQNPNCATQGCSFGKKYLYCD